MIRKLWIDSFKAFATDKSDAPGIPLQPFTVLVGPNGAGKSTILQAIDMLGWLSSGSLRAMLDAHQWDYADLRHLRGRGKWGLHAEVELPSSSVLWSLELSARESEGIAEELIEKRAESARKVVVERHGREVERFSERTDKQDVVAFAERMTSWLSIVDPRSDQTDYPTLVALSAWAKRIRAYYFLDPVALRAPSRAKEAKHDDLGLHGENLAAFLARIKTRPKDFARVIERTRTHYPRLVDIAVKKTSYGWTNISITEKWNGETATFNARQVSDGLLRLIAVAAMHELREPPSVLLLDEIENGLHPRLLGGFVAMLEELAKSGRTQVIVATHSPITLNYVSSPESVLLVTRKSGGGVRVTPLPETKGFSSLREQFELGELWYNAGEERLVPKEKGQ